MNLYLSFIFVILKLSLFNILISSKISFILKLINAVICTCILGKEIIPSYFNLLSETTVKYINLFIICI